VNRSSNTNTPGGPEWAEKFQPTPDYLVSLVSDPDQLPFLLHCVSEETHNLRQALRDIVDKHNVLVAILSLKSTLLRTVHANSERICADLEALTCEFAHARDMLFSSFTAVARTSWQTVGNYKQVLLFSLIL
jgi:hypothetical protein